MSNKPRNVKRLVPHKYTAGEIYHHNVVVNAMNHHRNWGAYSSRHVGSKRIQTMKYIKNEIIG